MRTGAIATSRAVPTRASQRQDRETPMGLIDSIQNAASSVGSAVSSGIDHAHDAAETVAHKVHDAPAAVARGAIQAVNGVKELGKHAVNTGAKLAHDGVDLLHRGPKEVLAAAGRGAQAAGTWAWKNKGEIGFWVGTSALMLAVPVSGGASGALAGGLMAARGAAIAAKLAQAGRVGLTAVKAARAGASAVQGVRTAIGATKVGSVLARGGDLVRTGRGALGGTKLGRGMIAAQKPVTAASTVIAGANVADTSARYAKGDASLKDLALATLGFAPAGVGAVKSAATRRAASANTQAAQVAVRRLDDVAARTAEASDDVARVANLAPRANAPITADKAGQALEDAVQTTQRAENLRHRAALTSTKHGEDAISASALVDELDGVAAGAGRARTNAAGAEAAAPNALTSTAKEAKRNLQHAEHVAASTRDEISSLATTQLRADRVASRADRLKKLVGTAGMHAGNINNGVQTLHHKGDVAFLPGILGWAMRRNAAAMPARAQTGAPPTRAS